MRTSVPSFWLGTAAAAAMALSPLCIGPLPATGVLPGLALLEAQEVEPLEVNRERLVEMAVVGHIRQPTLADPPYRVAPDGTVRSLPGTSSITYNFRVGDSAVNMAGDHVEPAVSITTEPTPEQRGLNVYAQIGNAARVVSGQARGAEGVVIGKHGGIENVMVEFPDEVYDDLVIGDRIQIRAIGLGMEATNVEGVAIRNLSPDLLALLTSATGNIEPVLDAQANLATLLGLR